MKFAIIDESGRLYDPNDRVKDLSVTTWRQIKQKEKVKA